MAVLPLSATPIMAVGIGSNISSDTNYTKCVLRLSELDSNDAVTFRTSFESSPVVQYIAICKQ